MGGRDLSTWAFIYWLPGAYPQETALSHWAEMPTPNQIIIIVFFCHPSKMGKGTDLFLEVNFQFEGNMLG